MQTSEQTLVWKRAHPASILFGAVRSIVQTVVWLVFGAVAMRDSLLFPIVILLFVVMPILGQVLKYFGFAYACADGMILIKEGILSRKNRSIPVSRIHNINSSQNLAARILRVVRLDIETAGGSASEASFSALSLADAETIQNYVRQSKTANQALPVEDTSGVVPEPEAEVLHQMSVKHVLLAGATSNRIGAIAFGAILFGQYMEYSRRQIGPDQIANEVRNLAGAPDARWMVLGTIGLGGLVIGAWLFGIGLALVRWYGFTLAREGKDVKIKSGLFTLRQFLVPLTRVQALRISSSALRRVLKLVQIQVRSAGHVGIQEQSRVESDMLVPVTRQTDADRFVQFVYPDAHFQDLTWKATHVFGRNRAIKIHLATITLATAVAFIPMSKMIGSTGFLAMAVFVIGVGCLREHLQWKQSAYAYDSGYVYIRSGALKTHYWIVPISKVQTVSYCQTPGQRRRGLATLKLDLAGPRTQPDPELPHIPEEEALALFHGLSGAKVSPRRAA